MTTKNDGIPTAESDALAIANRKFNEKSSGFIRNYQATLKRGIDRLSDSDLTNIKEGINFNGDATELRDLLSKERRKTRMQSGPLPYLQYRKHAGNQSHETQTQIKLHFVDTVANDQEIVNAKVVHIEDLKIDESYQRSDVINKAVVNKIAAHFSLIRCNTIVVGLRKDGSMWVVDGQHRVMAAKRAGVARLPCAVFSSNGPQHEASVFYDLNKTRTGMNAYSVYKAMLIQKEPKTVEIQKILTDFRFRIGNGSMNTFKAASAIREVYERGVLPRVLSLIHDISTEDTSERWKKMLSQSHFIQSLGLIYSSKEYTVDESRMRVVFSRMSHTEYQRIASSCSGATGGRAKRIAPVLISEYYNKNLRVGRIDS